MVRNSGTCQPSENSVSSVSVCETQIVFGGEGELREGEVTVGGGGATTATQSFVPEQP